MRHRCRPQVDSVMLRTWFIALVLLATEVAADPLMMGIRGHRVEQEFFSLFAVPRENVRLDLASYDSGKFQLLLDGEDVASTGEGFLTFTAPQEPGLYTLDLRHQGGEGHARLNLFVGTKLGEEEVLNGYRIGPAPPGNESYATFYRGPQAYFEVTPANVDALLSPNFTLRQFLCKQASDYPKYIVLQESLLVLLEGLLQEVRDAGYPAKTFGVISGYRTPWYNRTIGNVANSRHVYGDAMDIFIDDDNDGVMDDLNGDGENNRADVDLFYQIVEKFKNKPGNGLLVGGVGRYYKTSNHGGFVHVDARGFKARW